MPPDPSHTMPASLPARILRRVLARYDLGTPASIEPILRGGTRTAKLLITTDRGRYVLKQHESDDPFGVAFMHRVILELDRAGVPVPPLVGTLDDNNSIVQADGRVFQITRVIDGRPCAPTAADARASGAMLRRVHDALDAAPSLGDDAPDHPDDRERLRSAFDRIAGRPDVADAAPDARDTLGELRAIDVAAEGAIADAQAGRAEGPRGLIHGDWHPGNLILGDAHAAGPAVVGVLDFDRCRLARRADELAFAALQHGLTKNDNEPGAPCDRWAPHTDLGRVAAFLSGYDAVPAALATTLAWRMIQRLIAEGVTRLAADGAVGRHPGPSVLRMLRAKSRWLAGHADAVGDLVRNGHGEAGGTATNPGHPPGDGAGAS